MILYTLAINQSKRSRQVLKTVLVYLAISVFCVVFNNVYALYGHGVHSDSMTYMFLYPLLGGVLPFALLWFFSPQADTVNHYRLFYNCYNSGTAALTLGSCIIGIFEIAGTSSPYTIVYAIGGWTMIFVASIAYVFNWILFLR